MVRARTTQMVFYSVYGFAPNRTTTIEFQAAKSRQLNTFYHFQIQFFENLPGVVSYTYFNLSDAGNSSTIGVQGRVTLQEILPPSICQLFLASPGGSFVKYSFNQATISTNNLTLTFDTNSNTFLG